MTHRYAAALEQLLDDDDNDAVLVMNVPTALASAVDAAKSVIAVTEKQRKQRVSAKPVFAVWIGGSRAGSGSLRCCGHSQLCDGSGRGRAASCISCAIGNRASC